MEVAKNDITDGLRHLGLRRGSIIMVHSSLSSFGHVDGGADTVIDALLEAVGPEGTVVMPTFSTNTRETKDGSHVEILPYDPDTTPVSTGAIPETFRKRPGAIRSKHPIFSLAAIGPKAAEVIKSLHSLVEQDAYILLLGVGLDTNSTMHLSEGIARPPQYLQRISTNEMERLGKNPDQAIGRRLLKAEGPWPKFTKMEKEYLESGIMKKARIGDATVRLLRARPMVELFTNALRTDPDRFYPDH